MTNMNENLLIKCQALKHFQNAFIDLNKRKCNAFTAPELYDTPENWLIEFRSQSKPDMAKSRLQKLLELTQENYNLIDIIEIIKSTDNDNIIWEIEYIFKKDNFMWDAFMFSLVASTLFEKVNNFAWKKWAELHTDGWLLPYSNPPN